MTHLALAAGTAHQKRNSTKRRTVDLDNEIGRRVRTRRLELRRSQSDLAKAIRITFQQVQKYEKGVNRISASTLVKIAHYLECPPIALLGDSERTAETALGERMTQTRAGCRTATAFLAIESRDDRAMVMTLAERLAKGDAS